MLGDTMNEATTERSDESCVEESDLENELETRHNEGTSTVQETEHVPVNEPTLPEFFENSVVSSNYDENSEKEGHETLEKIDEPINDSEVNLSVAAKEENYSNETSDIAPTSGNTNDSQSIDDSNASLDSRSSAEDDNYSTGSSCSEDIKDAKHQTDDSGNTQKILFNRFSSWRQQAVSTLKQTTTSLSNTATTNYRTANWTTFPLNSASLSPSVSPTANISAVGENNAVASDNNQDVTDDSPGNSLKNSVDTAPTQHPSNNDLFEKHPEIDSGNPISNISVATKNGLPKIDVLSRAAATVAESVQTSYFRGRYSNSLAPVALVRSSSNTSNTTATTNATSSHSQTARILSSPQAVHLRELIQSLQHNEVVMLLGKGRLGVNLKQSYKKNTGVFIDFFVEGGAAHTAAVASVGDILKQIGSDAQMHGTILSVPAQIAKAPRPVHLIFRSGTTDSSNISKINHLDVCVALMHELLQQNVNLEQLSELNDDESDATYIFSHFDSFNDLIYTTSPHPSLQKAYAASSARRNMMSAEYHTDELGKLVELPYNEELKVKEICQLAASNAKNFRLSLKSAFALSCIDCRRTPFLRSHFSGSSTPVVVPDANSVLYMYPKKVPKSIDDDQANQANMMLELFLEMLEFTNCFEVTPAKRRLSLALKIAHKYILPKPVTVNGLHTLSPPPMDLHSALVPDCALRKLEAILLTNEIVPRDVFWEYQNSCIEQLACGKGFARFMISPECARMRAYLRNTAPYVNIPLDAVLSEISGSAKVDIHAWNCLQYIIMFLVSLTDKDVYGENDEILDQNAKSMVNASPDKSASSKAASGKPPASERVEDVANGLCAAIYIRSKLLPAADVVKSIICSEQIDSRRDELSSLVEMFEQLWEVFVAPTVGALATAAASSMNEEEILEKLHCFRTALENAAASARTSKPGNDNQDRLALTCKLLLEDTVLSSCADLADELLYDYAVNVHSKFRMHKFHEWMCEEFLIAKHYGKDTGDDIEITNSLIPVLPHGCIKRLLRKTDFPVGVSVHKPSSNVVLDETSNSSVSHAHRGSTSKQSLSNAECAIVFGSRVGSDETTHLPCPGLNHVFTDVRRYCCHSVALDTKHDESESISLLQPQDIPPTLESYAIGKVTSDRSFGCYKEYHRIADGWRVSLVDFVVPRSEDSASSPLENDRPFFYGVSLLFQREKSPRSSISPEDSSVEVIDEHIELMLDNDCSVEDDRVLSLSVACSESDSSQVQAIRKIQVSESCPQFNRKLRESRWTHRVSSDGVSDPVTIIGVAFISQRNVIAAMRSALSLLLQDYCKPSNSFSNNSDQALDVLANVLGNFSNAEVESYSLKCILEPYIRRASMPWLDRPITAQHDAFVQNAGQRLIRSLPPIPLALMFVAALLEQKIVFSSSRRGLLLSATVALSELLKPLKWCHVLVPLIPSSLAADLLQYPAPFILGLCSEDPGVLDLVRELSPDVTLVDLDVGRVILASSFAHDSELGRGTPNNTETARALRSQVLFLAQSLGTVFGAQLDSESWCCDLPDTKGGLADPISQGGATGRSDFDRLRLVCREFVEELLAGATSCCYWIEEALSDEYKASGHKDPTVLFDEDRFFHIKNFRERDGGFQRLFQDQLNHGSHKLALSLDNFDLILELFLRCQSMNAYIGTRKRSEMVFSMS